MCFGLATAAVYNATDTLNQPPVWYEVLFPDFQDGPGFQFATSYNNGPGLYEITFEDAGTETITTEFILSDRVGDEDGKDPVMTFENVPTYNLKIRNVLEYDRPDVNDQGVLGTSTAIRIAWDR